MDASVLLLNGRTVGCWRNADASHVRILNPCQLLHFLFRWRLRTLLVFTPVRLNLECIYSLLQKWPLKKVSFQQRHWLTVADELPWQWQQKRWTGATESKSLLKHSPALLRHGRLAEVEESRLPLSSRGESDWTRRKSGRTHFPQPPGAETKRTFSFFGLLGSQVERCFGRSEGTWSCESHPKWHRVTQRTCFFAVHRDDGVVCLTVTEFVCTEIKWLETFMTRKETTHGGGRQLHAFSLPLCFPFRERRGGIDSGMEDVTGAYGGRKALFAA